MDRDDAAGEPDEARRGEKPAAAIMSAKRSAAGNLRIEFDEIAIGRAVARDDLADRRNGGERIGVVERDRARGRSTARTRGKGSVRRASARERPRRAPGRCAARCGCRRRSCRRRTRRRRTAASSALASTKVDALAGRALRWRARAPTRSMSALMSSDGHVRSRGPPASRDAEGDVAGAAGDVEMGERARRATGRTLATRMSFQTRCRPNDIRSFITIVAVGDLVENRVDEPLLLLQAHLAFAKMRVLGTRGHLKSPWTAVF